MPAGRVTGTSSGDGRALFVQQNSAPGASEHVPGNWSALNIAPNALKRLVLAYRALESPYFGGLVRDETEDGRHYCLLNESGCLLGGLRVPLK